MPCLVMMMADYMLKDLLTMNQNLFSCRYTTMAMMRNHTIYLLPTISHSSTVNQAQMLTFYNRRY